MSGDGFREPSKCVLHALVSKGLIELNECCRTDHIGMQENSELACWFFGHNDPFVVILRATTADGIVGGWSWRTNGGNGSDTGRKIYPSSSRRTDGFWLGAGIRALCKTNLLALILSVLGRLTYAVRHEVARVFIKDDPVFCHRDRTGTCVGGNPGVRSFRDNVASAPYRVGNRAARQGCDLLASQGGRELGLKGMANSGEALLSRRHDQQAKEAERLEPKRQVAR